jgi:hypothetical protein
MTLHTIEWNLLHYRCAPRIGLQPLPADVCAPVPCPAAPLRPGYAYMVPSTGVRRNSREVPISLLLLLRPPVTAFFGPIKALEDVSTRHGHRMPPQRFYCPGGNSVSQQLVAVGAWSRVYSVIIGSDVKLINRNEAYKPASRAASLSSKRPVIHS